jgi:hypothetical protein
VTTADHAGHFSLVTGGPFHAALHELRLTRDDRLPTARAAVLLALFAWMLPAAFAVAQTFATDGAYDGWRYFTDGSAYARFLVAIAVMIATESYADGRLRRLIDHFQDSHLVSAAALPAYREALARADRQSSSARAEAVVLALAILASGATTASVLQIDRGGWEAIVRDGVQELSWAGAAVRFGSGVLFQFLVIRWLWRFAVWTILLYRISRLRLRLAPLHPDRAAGLGFLSIYPGIFSGFLFAQSCVIASTMLKDLAVQQLPSELVWTLLGAWIAFGVALFVGPLLVFARALYDAREQALLEFGRLATQHHLAFHDKWIDPRADGADLMGTSDVSSASDLNAIVQMIEGLRLVPIDRRAVLQLLLAAGIPLLAVVAKEVPLREALGWIVGTLL